MSRLTYVAASIGEPSPIELSTIVSVALRLKMYGFTLRTPDYSPVDKVFQLAGSNKEVYLTHKPDKIPKHYPLYYPDQDILLRDRAMDILSAFVDLRDAEIKRDCDFHLRNVFLLLGHDLKSKTDILLNIGNRKVGNLSTMAARYNIPEFNIMSPRHQQKLFKLAKELSISRKAVAENNVNSNNFT
jgi:hypothetical protein